MPQIRNALIFSLSGKSASSDVSRKIEHFLQENGVNVDVKEASSSDIASFSLDYTPDIAVSVGGDGTVLTCANLLKDKEVPIIPVNVGSFGYITDTEADEFARVFDDYINDRSLLRERMMIEASVLRNGTCVFFQTALNDITVFSDSRSKLAVIELYINDLMAGNMRADGLLVSTPTGSTAYNFAAGGPILDPEMKAFVINTICPFSMNCRPLVVDSSSVIGMNIPLQKAEISVTFDGHDTFELKSGDCVVIRKSSHKAFFVENTARSPISILRYKLGWAESYSDVNERTS